MQELVHTQAHHITLQSRCSRAPTMVLYTGPYTTPRNMLPICADGSETPRICSHREFRDPMISLTSLKIHRRPLTREHFGPCGVLDISLILSNVTDLLHILMASTRCLVLSQLLAGVACFTPVAQLSPTTCAGRSAAPRCGLEEVSARRAVLAGAVGVALGSGVMPAWAGYVTSLGIETTQPKDADKDDDVLKTKEVQAGLENIKVYKTSAASLKSKFLSDSNVNLIPAIRKDFDFSKVAPA